MSDYDLTKRSDHPLGTTHCPEQRGERERAMFGVDRQSPQQLSESWSDYQRRIHGCY